jgi:hypothetical protein
MIDQPLTQVSRSAEPRIDNRRSGSASTPYTSLTHVIRTAQTVWQCSTWYHTQSDLPVDLAQPARRALVNAGYLRLARVAELSETEVKQLHGIEPKALDQLRRALRASGLSFAGESSRERSDR